MSNNVRVQARRKGALLRREKNVADYGTLVATTKDPDQKKGYERKLELAQEDVANLKKKLGSYATA